jgi:WD40 repeat protein
MEESARSIKLPEDCGVPTKFISIDIDGGTTFVTISQNSVCIAGGVHKCTAEQFKSGSPIGITNSPTNPTIVAISFVKCTDGCIGMVVVFQVGGHNGNVFVLAEFKFKSGAYSVTFTPDGNNVVVGTATQVCFCNIPTGSESILYDHGCPVTSVCAINNHTIVSGCWDGSIIIQDMVTKTQITAKIHTGAVSCIKFHPLQGLTSSGWDGKIVVWDHETMKPFFDFKAGDDVLSIAFDQDGSLYSLDNGYTISRWNYDTCRPSRQLIDTGANDIAFVGRQMVLCCDKSIQNAPDF